MALEAHEETEYCCAIVLVVKVVGDFDLHLKPFFAASASDEPVIACDERRVTGKCVKGGDENATV